MYLIVSFSFDHLDPWSRYMMGPLRGWFSPGGQFFSSSGGYTKWFLGVQKSQLMKFISIVITVITVLTVLTIPCEIVDCYDYN